MTRSLWKGPFIDTCLVHSLQKKDKPIVLNSVNTQSQNKHSTKQILLKNSQKLWSRRSVILPQFLDSSFEIYNGKQFIKLKITENMVGHKFGEFALTRKKPKHPTLRKNVTTKKK